MIVHNPSGRDDIPKLLDIPKPATEFLHVKKIIDVCLLISLGRKHRIHSVLDSACLVPPPVNVNKRILYQHL